MKSKSVRPIWKGAITFGLVSIPISLFPAVCREELKFRLLRKADLSPINYKRIAEADGKEVPWDQIVKGYEYEKDKFVVLKEDDFKRADVEATQTVDIINFVKLNEINPMLFNKPFYMEAGRGGDKAYVLLRNVLVDSGKVGIAKVVIKTRQHLATIKPQKSELMLELMHFPDELLDATEFKSPAARTVGKAELKMARQLVESMSVEWHPDMYRDDYRETLEKIIETKIEHGGKEKPARQKKAARPSNVIDLVSVLQQSIKETQGKSRSKRKAPTLKKAA